MAKLQARIRNMEFVDDLAYGATGFLISPDGWEGWDSGVDTRREMIAFQAAHGSYDFQGYADSRVISISGVAVADSPEELGWMRSRLTGLLADGGSARLVVDHQGETLWSDVRLASQTKFVVRAANPTLADFQVQFWAADPRKYGESHDYPLGTGTPVFQYGNFPATATVKVTGTGTADYAIYGPNGKSFVVSANLTSGHPHTIDLRSGRLLIDGFPQFASVVTADSWFIPGGEQVAHSFDPNGNTATAVLTVLDTFI